MEISRRQVSKAAMFVVCPWGLDKLDSGTPGGALSFVIRDLN